MDNDRIKVLYIAGFGRNGGTLLDRILGQINGFFSLGEFIFVWQYGVIENDLCTCGVPFRSCRFWAAAFQRAFGGFDEIDARRMIQLHDHVARSRYLPLLISPWKPKNYRKKCRQYADITQTLFTAINEESQCHVLVDSSKFSGYAMILDMIPNVDLYVVHLVRDSRATASSWRKKKLDPGAHDQIRYAPQASLLSSSLQWTHRNISAEALRYLAKGFLPLRYEDFASNPKASINKIISLLNEPVGKSPFIDDFTVLLEETHTQWGSTGRFKQGEVEIHLDSDWQRYMSLYDKCFVTSLTWPLLIKYGYWKQRADTHIDGG